MVCAGAVCLCGAVWVARRLPVSRNFESTTRTSFGVRLASMWAPLRDPVLIKFWRSAGS